MNDGEAHSSGHPATVSPSPTATDKSLAIKFEKTLWEVKCKSSEVRRLV